ncbi:hypothetical protein PCANC_03064 [Puccinia coronata f. sp. avenae]|nr:hypothetical protein PCASD_21975 [Puccinia coronata f. sp. avenae]PLW57192.1 hypothetical protein PCANC_03064 [Puccinia coronata f. sp. avenae]
MSNTPKAIVTSNGVTNLPSLYHHQPNNPHLDRFPKTTKIKIPNQSPAIRKPPATEGPAMEI